LPSCDADDDPTNSDPTHAIAIATDLCSLDIDLDLAIYYVVGIPTQGLNKSTPGLAA
jgi:hypothetical protein